MKRFIFTPMALLAALGCSETPLAPALDSNDILSAPLLVDIDGATLSVSPQLTRFSGSTELGANVAVSPHVTPLQVVPQELTVSDLWVVSEGVFIHRHRPDLVKSESFLGVRLTGVDISNLSGLEVTVGVRVVLPAWKTAILRSQTVLFPKIQGDL